ncbi:MAG TPA: peptidoglycan-binding protein [Solirubrobacteraceae bacterium]|nr:peptidoglycan-binding protein [Solirubrobacteraceae bacterium]
MVYRQVAALSALLLLVWPVVGADAAGTPAVAALQVALLRKGVYAGAVDGVAGPLTRAAVRRLQARDSLVVDGIAGPETRRALGPFARHTLGLRVLRPGDRGWDVAEAQFELAWDGFPSGAFDGDFGPHLAGAVRRFQRARALRVDGAIGPQTLAALREPTVAPPLRLRRPVDAPLGDRFGPRGDRFHAGVDFPAPAGTPVTAAASGRVVWSGPRDGWGVLVTLADGGGIRTLYAHLETIAVRLGEHVAAGALVGRVGATGDATGPNLHFEVRAGGAAVDPAPLLARGMRAEVSVR